MIISSNYSKNMFKLIKKPFLISLPMQKQGFYYCTVIWIRLFEQGTNTCLQRVIN